jgi:hypothetical protein
MYIALNLLIYKYKYINNLISIIYIYILVNLMQYTYIFH